LKIQKPGKLLYASTVDGEHLSWKGGFFVDFMINE
jgi:hypothetical protein